MRSCVDFFEFRFDLVRQRLTRQGEPVEMEAKAAALLAHLIRHRSRVVAKAELIDAVWPDTATTPSSLTTCVNKVRAALGRRGATIVKSYYGRGYRFTAECVADGETRDTGTPDRPTSAILGRDAELDAADQALRRAVAGRGTFLLIDGERGIGKSRLLQEIDVHARSAGLTSVIARCGAPEANAIARIVSVLVRSARKNDRNARIAGRARDVATTLSRPPRTPLPASRQTLFQLFDDVAILLRAQEATRVVLADDLHRADETTLSFISFLARDIARLPLMLVATADLERGRQGAGTSGNLIQLALLANAQRVSLSGLSPRDAATLLSFQEASELDSAATRWIIEHAAGNPWLLEALASAAQSAEAKRVALESITGGRLPREVRAWVAEHLGRVSSDCRALLAYAAGFGRDIDVRVLSRDLARRDGRKQRDVAEVVLQHLEDAAAARLIEAPSTVTTTYRFSHPLVALALRTES